MAREGEEAMLAVFMALRCGLPPPSNERRTRGDRRGEDWHRLPLHREERETTRGRTIAAECDCAFLVHPATKKYVRRARGSQGAAHEWEGVHGFGWDGRPHLLPRDSTQIELYGSPS